MSPHSSLYPGHAPLARAKMSPRPEEAAPAAVSKDLPATGAEPLRFQPPAPGARTTRAQLLDAHGHTFGLYRIETPEPPIYLADGPIAGNGDRPGDRPLVFALQRSQPHPSLPETWAVYREITPAMPADVYPLDRATRLQGD